MKDKLDQAVADDRLITTQNQDEADLNQRQTLRQLEQGGTMVANRFATPPNLAFTRQLPVNPQNTDLLARMMDRATDASQMQQQGLLAQFKAAMANPAAMPRILNAMFGQIISMIKGNRLLPEEDRAIKDIRDKADEEAARENPGLLLVDVTNASNVNAGPQ
jgi:hypothetical protein